MNKVGMGAARALSLFLLIGVVLMVLAVCVVAAVTVVLGRVDPTILAALPMRVPAPGFAEAAFGTVAGRVALWLALSESLMVGIVVAIVLRRMLTSAMRGSPFEAANISRLRLIAAAYAFGIVMRFLVPPFAPAAVAQWLVDTRWAYEISGLGPLLVALVLAEIFREGVRLREDSDLAI